MTNAAKEIMDDFVIVCKKAGNTVYNQGVVDGLVNLRDIINEKEDISIEEIKETIDRFINDNTVGGSKNLSSEVKIHKSDKVNTDESNKVDFSQNIPIEELPEEIDSMIKAKQMENMGDIDVMGNMNDAFDTVEEPKMIEDYEDEKEETEKEDENISGETEES